MSHSHLLASEALESKYAALKYAESTLRGDARDRQTLDVLRNSECFYLSSDIGDTISEAAKTLPLTFELHESLCTQWVRGWVFLQKPWPVGQWGGTHDEFIGTDGYDPRAPMKAFTFGFGPSIRDSSTLVLAVEGYIDFRRKLVPICGSFMRCGHTVASDIERRTSELASDPLRAAACSRLVANALTMLLWCQQKIVIAPELAAERHARKRLGLSPKDSNIRVIQLRRAEQREGESSQGDSPEWSCRWIVGGHWRNQYHPSNGGHVPTWILPYVKGPEDKPLKVPTQTVYQVSR